MYIYVALNGRLTSILGSTCLHSSFIFMYLCAIEMSAMTYETRVNLM